MTVREKIGQMIMIAFRKWKVEGNSEEKKVTEINDEIKSIVKDYSLVYTRNNK